MSRWFHAAVFLKLVHFDPRNPRIDQCVWRRSNDYALSSLHHRSEQALRLRSLHRGGADPISESGGNILGYFLPTDFAGATSEAFGLIDFPSLAEYEVYRAKLAAHPLHKKNVAALESKGAVLSIQRSLIQRVAPTKEPRT